MTPQFWFIFIIQHFQKILIKSQMLEQGRSGMLDNDLPGIADDVFHTKLEQVPVLHGIVCLYKGSLPVFVVECMDNLQVDFRLLLLLVHRAGALEGLLHRLHILRKSQSCEWDMQVSLR